MFIYLKINDEEKITRGIAVFKDYLDMASAIGCDTVGSETGSYNGDPWIYHPMNHSDEALNRVVSTFGELAEYAKERGVNIGMEGAFGHVCHTPERLYEAAEAGADVVVGSRYVCGVNIVNWPMSRLLMSYFASKYVRLVTRMPVHDATAGFVCYSRRALQTIDLDRVQMKGYGFQIEMKYSAWRLGLKIQEVSIIFTERREGASKMSGGIFGEAFFGVLKLPFRKIRRAE